MAYNKTYTGTGETNERGTPWELFNLLHNEFAFIADMAATASNTKCSRWYTKEEDALSIKWPVGTVYCNPPYSRSLVGKFVAKARLEALESDCRSVLLLPVSTSSRWWMGNVVPREVGLTIEVRFMTPRVEFIRNDRPMGNCSMTPNCVVVFTPGSNARRFVRWWDWRSNEYIDMRYD